MSELAAMLEEFGLVALGETAEGRGRLVLVGNAGSLMWYAFRDSDEYADGLPDPLDRWSRRVGQRVAGQFGATAVFPFDGPPWPPFSAWAMGSGRSFRSPVSMQIHPRYGLWHAYRFALRFESPVTSMEAAGSSPCLQCIGQPCLSACPVDAFSAEGYRARPCLDHLAGTPRPDCVEAGCAARRACPVGKPFQYEPGHARFHMEAFIRAQRGASGH